MITEINEPLTETQKERIRTRVSYMNLKRLAKALLKRGVDNASVGFTVDYIYTMIDNMQGYRSATMSEYAEESKDLLKEDLKLY